MTKTPKATGWHRQGPGLYRKGAFTVAREADEAGKVFWACRHGGKIFDRAATLAEAKGYCDGEA